MAAQCVVLDSMPAFCKHKRGTTTCNRTECILPGQPLKTDVDSALSAASLKGHKVGDGGPVNVIVLILYTMVQLW